MKIPTLACATLLVLGAYGCSKNTIPDPEVSGTDTGTGADASTGGYGAGGMGAGEYLDDDLMGPDGEMGMVIYFDFDQSELKPEYTDLLARHATHLANNPGTSARLEGHADERGSREYNIGLGERQFLSRLAISQTALNRLPIGILPIKSTKITAVGVIHVSPFQGYIVYGPLYPGLRCCASPP